jgi:hypothetical protein
MSCPAQDPLCSLFIRRPDLVPALLAGLGIKIPHHSVVRAAHADPVAAARAPQRADVVLQLDWSPVIGIVVEVMRSIGEEQRRRWPQLLAALRLREQCAVELLVVTADQAVATWAGQPLVLGERQVIPRVLFVPPVINLKRALKDHQLAMLSAVAHAGDPDEGRALQIAQVAQKAILSTLRDEEAGWYLGVIRESFPVSRRDKLVTPIVCPYNREQSRQHFTLGVAKALLDKLVRRHGALAPGVIEHVLTLSLDELARLRHRLATSQSLDEALAEPVASLAGKQGTAAHQIEELARARQTSFCRKRSWSWPWGRTA